MLVFKNLTERRLKFLKFVGNFLLRKYFNIIYSVEGYNMIGLLLKLLFSKKRYAFLTVKIDD